MNKYFAIVSSTAALVGCLSLPSVGPDYEAPKVDEPKMTLPDAGQPPEMTNEDVRVTITNDKMKLWWKQLNDSVLDELIEAATTSNLSYQMTIKRLEEANWTLLGTYSEFLPKMNANASWTAADNHRHNSSMVSTGLSKKHSTVGDLGLAANWEIDVFGGNRRMTEAALALTDAAEYDVANAWLTLTTELGIQYVNLRTTQERIEVAETNLVLQTETYDILKSRLDSGIGDELAVNQCKYIVEQTRASIPPLKAQEEALKNAISILCGVMPGEMHEKLKPVETKRDWMVEPQKLADLPVDMIRQRPDAQAAERRLAAQTAYIGVAKSSWYPKFYITGGVGYQNAQHSAKLFDHGAMYASIGPSASWAIFSGGAIYAQVKSEEAKTEEAFLNYENTLQKAYADARNSYSSYTQEYHRNDALKNALKAATDAVEIAQDLYKNGIRDFNNVLDAQRSRLSIEEQYVVSRGQITVDLIELYKSLGGGLATEDSENEE